jgi:hypothetical protein
MLLRRDERRMNDGNEENVLIYRVQQSKGLDEKTAMPLQRPIRRITVLRIIDSKNGPGSSYRF